MYTICKLPHRVKDVQPYFDCIERSAAGRGLADCPQFEPLLKEIRALIPIDGDDWVHHTSVLIKPNQKNHQGQFMHQHPEWTAVFYVQLGDPPVPVLIEDDSVVYEITPAPGDVVIMSPHTEHGVAPSKSDIPRLSFAMLVKDPDIPSNYTVR